MATPLILSSKQPKVEGCTLAVRPFPASDFNSHSPSLPPKFQPLGQKATVPASPPVSLQLRTTTLLPNQELRTTTPSPAPQRGHWGSPCTRSSNGAPEEINKGNSLHARKPDGVTPASSSGHSQGWQGAAKRFWNFILRDLCVGHPPRSSTAGGPK